MGAGHTSRPHDASAQTRGRQEPAGDGSAVRDDDAHERRQDRDGDGAAELDHHSLNDVESSLEMVEPSLEMVESGVDSVEPGVNSVETALDVAHQVVEALVGPGCSSPFHALPARIPPGGLPRARLM